jgi:hypothetical protein
MFNIMHPMAAEEAATEDDETAPPAPQNNYRMAPMTLGRQSTSNPAAFMNGVRYIQYCPQQPMQLNGWRAKGCAFTFVLLRHFDERGHLSLEPTDLSMFYHQLPYGTDLRPIIPAFLCVLQSLAVTPRTDQIFAEWSRREERFVPPRPTREAIQFPELCPWNMPTFWAMEMFSVAIQVVTKFLNQPVPVAEESFRMTLKHIDLIDVADNWWVEAMTYFLYKVWSDSWCWPTIFRESA